MSATQKYDFVRYLDAKKTVDDRALNKDVWNALKHEFESLSRTVSKPRVIEIGAGIGTMVERCMEWGLFQSCDYTAIDSMKENTEEADRRLLKWAEKSGWSLENPVDSRFLLERNGRSASVTFLTADFLDLAEHVDASEQWDVLLANAVLDLLDVAVSLPKLFRFLGPGGLFYFSVNFDGVTILEPAIDPGLDALIERLYHETMDRRITKGTPSGDSKAGRHLFGHLRKAGARLLSAGSSDWVVYGSEGGYPGNEAYFLHFIIDTIGNALAGHPELDSQALEDWIRVRHEQIDAGDLVYIAHQLDFLGRSPDKISQ